MHLFVQPLFLEDGGGVNIVKNGTLKFPHPTKNIKHDLPSTSNLLDVGHGSLGTFSPENKK